MHYILTHSRRQQQLARIHTRIQNSSQGTSPSSLPVLSSFPSLIFFFTMKGKTLGKVYTDDNMKRISNRVYTNAVELTYH